MRTTAASRALLLVLVLLLAACSSGDDAADGGSEPTDGGGAASGSTTVTTVDFAFEVAASAPAGEFVVVNEGEAPHTFTADNGTFDSGTVDPGAEMTITIDEPGSYSYICSIHPGQMSGTIEIT